MRRTFGQVNPSVLRPLIDPGNPLCRLLAVGVLSIFSAAGMAAFGSFSVDDIEGEGWRADGIAISLSEVAVDHYAVAITVATGAAGQPWNPRGSQARMPVSRDGSAWLCERTPAAAGVTDRATGCHLAGRYVDDGHLQITIPRRGVGAGHGGTGTEWPMMASGPYGCSLIAPRSRDWRPRVDSLRVAIRLGNQGRASGGSRRAPGWGQTSVDADLVFDQLAYASPDGTQAAEKIVVKPSYGGRVRKADGASMPVNNRRSTPNRCSSTPVMDA